MRAEHFSLTYSMILFPLEVKMVNWLSDIGMNEQLAQGAVLGGFAFRLSVYGINTQKMLLTGFLEQSLKGCTSGCDQVLSVDSWRQNSVEQTQREFCLIQAPGCSLMMPTIIRNDDGPSRTSLWAFWSLPLSTDYGDAHSPAWTCCFQFFTFIFRFLSILALGLRKHKLENKNLKCFYWIPGLCTLSQ